MSEIIITVEFTPESGGGVFQGNVAELINEVYNRAAILGTCSYRLIGEPSILYLIKGDK